MTVLTSIYDDAVANLGRELKSIEKRRGVKEGESKSSFAVKPGKIYTKKDAELIAKTIGEEVEDTLGGAYLSLAVDAKDFDELETKLVKASNDVKKKKSIVSGVGLASSEIVNQSRMDVYRQIENKIESYTYYNDDPKTDLCQYLNFQDDETIRIEDSPIPLGM